MGKSNVSTEEFVVAYMKMGGDLDAVSRSLGVGRAAAYQRVMKLRKAGVRLPIKRKHANSYDVRALNKLIKELKNNA